MLNHIDEEMLQNWIGLDYARNPGYRVVDIVGIGSQFIVFGIKHNTNEDHVLKILRSNIGFTIGLPQNQIFKMYNAPLLEEEGSVLESMETFQRKTDYYQSLYERFRLLIGSPLLAHIHPINIVCNRLAMGLIRYWVAKKEGKTPDDLKVDDLKVYAHLLGDPFVKNILEAWSMLDPEQIKQERFERSGMSMDIYWVEPDEDKIFLGSARYLSSEASSVLENLSQIFDELEIDRSVELKNNPLVPYLMAFTGGYEFDLWSTPDEIENLTLKIDINALNYYITQMAQITHALNNRDLSPRSPRIWLTEEEILLLAKIVGFTKGMSLFSVIKGITY